MKQFENLLLQKIYHFHTAYLLVVSIIHSSKNFTLEELRKHILNPTVWAKSVICKEIIGLAILKTNKTVARAYVPEQLHCVPFPRGTSQATSVRWAALGGVFP